MTGLTFSKRSAAPADRRAKQRKTNLLRAAKMRHARLKLKSVHTIPSAPPIKKTIAQPEYHVGCSGWFYWGWKGVFYPQDLPPNKWFEYYRRIFDTVELNAPFYAWPTLGSVQSWVRQTNYQPFVYSIKVCELITHIKSFRGTKTLVKDFSLIADLVTPHMGCFLFQLPPRFHYTPGRLDAILTQLDPLRRNVVEFRHASWWNKEVFSEFRKADVIFCSCSAKDLPDTIVRTAEDIYIRFHGTQKGHKHEYSAHELDEWASRILASGAKRVWAYFNNDYNGYAPKNARDLSAKLTGPEG